MKQKSLIPAVAALWTVASISALIDSAKGAEAGAWETFFSQTNAGVLHQ